MKGTLMTTTAHPHDRAPLGLRLLLLSALLLMLVLVAVATGHLDQADQFDVRALVAAVT